MSRGRIRKIWKGVPCATVPQSAALCSLILSPGSSLSIDVSSEEFCSLRHYCPKRQPQPFHRGHSQQQLKRRCQPVGWERWDVHTHPAVNSHMGILTYGTKYGDIMPGTAEATFIRRCPHAKHEPYHKRGFKGFQLWYGKILNLRALWPKLAWLYIYVRWYLLKYLAELGFNTLHIGISKAINEKKARTYGRKPPWEAALTETIM